MVTWPLLVSVVVMNISRWYYKDLHCNAKNHSRKKAAGINCGLYLRKDF